MIFKWKIIKEEIILVFHPNGYVSNVYLLLEISLRLERIERGGKDGMGKEVTAFVFTFALLSRKISVL